MSSVGSLEESLTEALPDTCTTHEEHLKLAGVVKGIHADLRRKYRSNTSELERIWYEHCQNKTILSQYAKAMHHLAVDHWSKNHDTRIDWCRETICEYYLHDGLKKALEKDERRKLHDNQHGSLSLDAADGEGTDAEKDERRKLHDNQHGSLSLDAAEGEGTDAEKDERRKLHDNQQGSLSLDAADSEGTGAENDDSRVDTGEDGYASSLASVTKTNGCRLVPFEGKIRTLDVGSCFNPFVDFPEFQAVGIDISPATESVFHCDFLHLRTTDPLQVAADTMTTFINNLKDPIEWLPRQCFHVVVFSLLLEYFPAPYQRWICCQKAHELLAYNGILVIVTPDSHAQHRNAPMIKSWKTAIESMGFKRWRYVKQEHLHCMVFRKISMETKGTNFINGITPDLLYIPQDCDADSHLDDLDFGTACYTFDDEEFCKETAFTELPHFASDPEDG